MPSEAGDDGVPRLLPISAGRRGPKPMLIKLPTLRDEAKYIIEQFKAAHRDGTAWKDMAILYRNWNPVGKVINDAFAAAGIPITNIGGVSFGFSNEQGTKNWA